jgi:hypothetical protein
VIVPYDADAQEILDRVYSAHRNIGSIISQDPLIPMMWSYACPSRTYREETPLRLRLRVAVRVILAIDHLEAIEHPAGSYDRILAEFKDDFEQEHQKRM